MQPKLVFIKLVNAIIIVSSLVLLSSCASKQDQLAVIDQGPELAIEGRISIRQFGKPVIIANYTWNRGLGLHGWNESFDVINQNGFTVFQLESNDLGTLVKLQNENRLVANLQKLIEEQLGINLQLKTLAKWINNEHLGEALPDKLTVNNIYLEVLKRDKNQLPSLLRISEQENVVAISIKHL